MTGELSQYEVYKAESSGMVVAREVEEGLDLILSHCSGPIFPRNISTAASHGAQFTVCDRDELLIKYRLANYTDCRINAYPLYLGYKGINRQAPDFIFIDLDLSTFKDDEALRRALEATLRKIKRELGAIPTVLWSGNGYHIYLSLKNFILEEITEFCKFAHPSRKFLSFAERWLSGGRNDTSHNPSFQSCLLRVPGTYNSKCIKYGISIDDARVKTIQKWDGNRVKVTKQMLIEFHHWLIDEKVEEQRRIQKESSHAVGEAGKIRWIEVLLRTPIADYRKNAIALILAPYLMNIKKLSEPEAMYVLQGWLQECDRLAPLDSDFKSRMKSAVRYAKNNGSKPLKFSTLKEKNTPLYELILHRLQQYD